MLFDFSGANNYAQLLPGRGTGTTNASTVNSNIGHLGCDESDTDYIASLMLRLESTREASDRLANRLGAVELERDSYKESHGVLVFSALCGWGMFALVLVTLLYILKGDI